MTTTRTARLLLALLALLAASAPRTEAAQPVTTYELTLRDGSRMYGTVEGETEAQVEFRTTGGVLTAVPRRDILSLRKIAGIMREGVFMRDDPNTTRLFFGPTGRALPKGRTYLGVYEFLLPFVQVGVTDRFSMGGGTPLFFSTEDWHRPFWLTPKLQVLDTGRTQVAAGAFLGFGGGDGGGIVYGVMTHEAPSGGSFTAGAGMAYASDGGHAPVVMAGGEGRLSRNTKIITENYVFKGGRGLASVGVRFFGEQLSADLALVVPINAESFFAAPVVNFVYMF